MGTRAQGSIRGGSLEGGGGSLEGGGSSEGGMLFRRGGLFKMPRDSL